MPTQKRNSNMVDLLRPDFQARYEPNFAIANAIPSFQQISELRGLWCASLADENGALRDMAQQGRTMTNNGAAPRSVVGLVPYVSYDGATQWHGRADEAGLDITGNLTIGGWFYMTNLVASRTFMSKYTVAGNQLAYILLYSSVSGALEFRVSTDGINNVTVPSTAVPTAGEWEFIVGRFIPQTELTIFVNRQKNTLVAGVPGAIFNSNAGLLIGGINGGASLLGYAWMGFLSAAALSDTVVTNFYEQTRAAFGR